MIYITYDFKSIAQLPCLRKAAASSLVEAPLFIDDTSLGGSTAGQAEESE